MPTALFFASPESLNSNHCNDEKIYPHLVNSPQKMRMEFTNASHCDFCDYQSACYLMSANKYEEERILLERKYLMAWLLYIVKGKRELEEFLFGDYLKQDIENGLLKVVFAP